MVVVLQFARDPTTNSKFLWNVYFSLVQFLCIRSVSKSVMVLIEGSCDLMREALLARTFLGSDRTERV